MRGAVSGNRKDDMRIDGGECPIDHFKRAARVFFPQQHFKIAVRGESLRGIAHRRRLTQNKNTERAGRFVDAEPERTGIAHNLLWEKPATEILVLNEEIFAANFE